MYTSEDFIIDNPRISYDTAKRILKAHGYTLGEYLIDAQNNTAESIDSADMIQGFMGY